MLLPSHSLLFTHSLSLFLFLSLSLSSGHFDASANNWAARSPHNLESQIGREVKSKQLAIGQQQQQQLLKMTRLMHSLTRPSPFLVALPFRLRSCSLLATHQCDWRIFSIVSWQTNREWLTKDLSILSCLLLAVALELHASSGTTTKIERTTATPQYTTATIKNNNNNLHYRSIERANQTDCNSICKCLTHWQTDKVLRLQFRFGCQRTVKVSCAFVLS